MYRGKDYVSDLRIEAIWKTKEILVMFQYLLPRSLPKKSKWVDTFTVNRTRYHKQSVKESVETNISIVEGLQCLDSMQFLDNFSRRFDLLKMTPSKKS